MKKEILKELQEALAKTDCHMLNVIAASGKTIALEIITPFIEKILEQQKEEIIKEIGKSKEERFICPNCGTNYIKKTPCGDYKCRNLEIIPVAEKWIPLEELKEKLEKL